jgi:hypothetical protein
MESLPLASSCSLDQARLEEQRARYRTVGRSGRIVSRAERQVVIAVSERVPDRLVEELVAVERECCPFFELDWQPGPRWLTVAVPAAVQAPALETIVRAIEEIVRAIEDGAATANRQLAEDSRHGLVAGDFAPHQDP